MKHVILRGSTSTHTICQENKLWTTTSHNRIQGTLLASAKGGSLASNNASPFWKKEPLCCRFVEFPLQRWNDVWQYEDLKKMFIFPHAYAKILLAINSGATIGCVIMKACKGGE